MNKLNEIGLLDESLVAIAQQRYQESKNKSITTETIKIKGSLYPGKTDKIAKFKTVAISSILTILLAVGLNDYAKLETLGDYKKATAEIVQEQLPEISDQLNYQNYINLDNNEGFFGELRQNKEILSQIKEEKEELKQTGNYKFFDASLNEDAIQNVAEENTLNSIKEAQNYYEEGANSYGK